MKAILEFNLDEPDDKHRHEVAVKSFDVLCELDNLDNNLRAAYKFSSHEWVRIEDIRRALSYVKDGDDTEIVLRTK